VGSLGAADNVDRDDFVSNGVGSVGGARVLVYHNSACHAGEAVSGARPGCVVRPVGRLVARRRGPEWFMGRGSARRALTYDAARRHGKRMRPIRAHVASNVACRVASRVTTLALSLLSFPSGWIRIRTHMHVPRQAPCGSPTLVGSAA